MAMAFAPFIISFLISLGLIPIVRRISFRVGRISFPRKDRWHSQPTPTLGGVAIFLGFCITLLIYGLSPELREQVGGYWGLLCGALFMFALGLYDDFKRISPPAKLIGQILAATIAIFFGDTIDFFPWPIANILLTYLWLVGITNAVNLLDNMDGLAGGVSFVAALVLSGLFLRDQNPTLLLFSLALAGSILGFLVFNFPPAKIFMGDSGTLFLGFTLAGLAIARGTKASNVFAILGVPTLLFLLPILDTTFVTITRLLRGQSPAQGGTDHTSHRLIAFGMTERQAVLVLYAIALLSGLAGAGLETIDYELSLILIPLLLIILSLLTAYLGRLKVVSTNSTVENGGIRRFLANLTYKRRLFELILDLLIIGVSYYLAYWTRYGLDMTTVSMGLFRESWPIALVGAYTSFYLSGVYRGVWRYIGYIDLLRYVKAVAGAVLITVLLILLIFPEAGYSLDVFYFYALYLFLGLTFSRSSFQVLDRLYSRQQRRHQQDNVLLYGADDAGEMSLRWVLRNDTLSYKIVGFMDDDPYKWGRTIHGVEVLGGLDKLDKIVSELEVDGVIFSSGLDLESENGVKLITILRAKGVWMKVLRLEFESLDE